jgi:Cu(I)/Ag(I) efflux system membrane fusion protein
MREVGESHPEPVGDNGSPESQRAPATHPSFGSKLWQIIKTVQGRLRFIVILAGVGAVLVYWDTLQAHYEKWRRPLVGDETIASAITEYWCPMHPTIIRDQPDKCPVCGMPLSKRRKGDAHAEETLPPGVVSRVQLTPYRVALAGIRTTRIGYQRLAKEIRTIGFVEFDERKLARITVRPSGRSRIDKLHVNVTGQVVQRGEPLALLYNPDLVSTVENLLDAQTAKNRDLQRLSRDRLLRWGIELDQIEEILESRKAITQMTIRSPISGHVIRKYQVEGEYVEEGSRLYDIADLSTVWIEAQVYEDELTFLKEGMAVSATTRAFPNREFKGQVAFIHPHLDARTRTLKVRFDMDNAQHDLRPGMYATVRLEVPVTQLNLLPADPGDKQKQSYEKGLMLAVPEQAVIDTGSRKLVYREAEPGLYEGVEVQLGPRCGGFYPVVQGLAEGDLVATAGSFLIDADTRLTGGAAATYFGSSAGPKEEGRGATTAVRPSTTRDEESKIQARLARLSAEDRRLAEAQKYCPIQQDNLLGSMGPPLKILLNDQPVFLCCKGCEKEARQRAGETLARVEKLKARTRQR